MRFPPIKLDRGVVLFVFVVFCRFRNSLKSTDTLFTAWLSFRVLAAERWLNSVPSDLCERKLKKYWNKTVHRHKTPLRNAW